MSELTSWAYLSRVVEGPNPHLQALLHAGRDADEIAEGVRTRASWLGGLAGSTEARYNRVNPEADLENGAKFGYQLLTPESPHWPEEMIRTSFTTPEAAKQPAGCPPHALWVRGETDLPRLFAQSVGFVGTRSATAYGHTVTSDLVSGLAAMDYTIVSGGALGIDTIAHQGAITSGTPTVAIAACGPGQAYPRRNQELFDRIVARGGSLITEYPPGVTPDRHRFLTRNRLIAAFSQGTVVVEAGYRSGALNTLKWVNAFNRVALAVPGSVLSQDSLGTNLAIADGRALPALSANHIHEMLGQLDSGFDPQLELEALFTPSTLQELPRNELRVYDSLPTAGSGGRDAETVAAIAGFSVGMTVHLLHALQDRNLVARDKLMWRRLERKEEQLQ